MKRAILLAALAAALSGAAHAQSWMYQSGPGGTPPVMHGGPYGAGGMLGYGAPGTYGVPSYSSAPSFTVLPLPQVPDVSRYLGEGPGPYGTALPSGPSGNPCTMPGCR